MTIASYASPWTHSGEVVDVLPEGYVSFVYLITCSQTGMKYVGKKGMFVKKTRQVKGKKKRYLVESDWKTYFGSSEEFKALVEELGVDAFQREILHYCKTKGEASYLEAKEQFQRDVLLRSDYANRWMSVRVRADHLKHLHLQPTHA